MSEERSLAVAESIRVRMRQGQFRLSKHATKRMDLRGRTLTDIQQVILTGEVIQEYPNENPYPEYLFPGHGEKSDEMCVL